MLLTETTKWHILHRYSYAEKRTLVTLHVSIVRTVVRQVGSATGTTHIRLKQPIHFYSVAYSYTADITVSVNIRGNFAQYILTDVT